MKEIALTKGFVAIVDDEDLESLNKFNWFAMGEKKLIYAMRFIYSPENKRRNLLMHRIITNCPSDKFVDHINHNTLDNRKENLRICTKQQNSRNNKIKDGVKFPFKGVRQTHNNQYSSSIGIDRKPIFIGTFENIQDAAIAYDIKAKEIFGEFAKLNFPNCGEEDINRVKLLIENSKKRKGNSEFRGVCWDKDMKKWKAKIQYKKIEYKIGYFTTEKEAALAYNKKAIELLGNKAKLNKIN